MSIKRICVFCGSRLGARASYVATAEELGRQLAERGIGLVYGGASVGTMGKLAEAALAAGGEVIGVIPKSMVEREIAHRGLTELYEVDSLTERKTRMLELSDGFIALPGGAGTLDELFEVLTWEILGYHAKPCALINLDGYYDRLLGFLDHAVAQGFIASEDFRRIIVADDPPTAISALLERTA